MSALFTDIDVSFSLIVEHVTQTELDAAGLSHWLTDDEQTRYQELQTLAVAKRSRQWLLGRYAAKVACRRWLEGQGMPIAEWENIQISNDLNGMPRLSVKGIEESPTLSIAHSGEDAVAAVATSGNPIGVDIESRTPRTNLYAIAKRITGEDEYQRWFVGITEKQLIEHFRKVWLAKEAAAKCSSKGLQWQPGVFEVIKLSGVHAEVSYEGNCYSIYYASSNVAVMALAWMR